MKTLTTLTAVAALIAGLSVAGAQGTMTPKSPSTTGSGAMGGSAKVTGSGKFCIKGSANTLNCQYASLSACQQAAKSGESCAANPNSGTTGSSPTSPTSPSAK